MELHVCIALIGIYFKVTPHHKYVTKRISPTCHVQTLYLHIPLHGRTVFTDRESQVGSVGNLGWIVEPQTT